MPRRILIAGQDEPLRARLQLHFVTAGYATVLADAAASGLAMHESHPFDLVILDLQSPTLDGLEILARFRLPQNGTRPAIIVFADIPPAEALKMATGLGVDTCLSTPVDVRVLLDLVDHMFRPERRATASTWYVEDEPMEPLVMEADVTSFSEPEDPDSVTFR